MCGIAGIYNFHGIEECQIPYLIRMSKAMSHRGPDDEGYLLINQDEYNLNYIGDDTPLNVAKSYSYSSIHDINSPPLSSLSLAHRRLSILDISPAGHQPMSTSNNQYSIVYNGEIYNYLEIKESLITLGHKFNSNSDTEVVLKSYTQWGERCLNRFNGDFSFVIYDRITKTLFCARDRIGIKPFYYHLSDSRMIFASDIKTLIASGLYKASPNYQGLYLAMSLGMSTHPITAFKDISALPPSTWLRIYRNGKTESGCYWSVPVNTSCNELSLSESIENIDYELRSSIKKRLVSDVPVGCFMSGGVDSTTIAAIASQEYEGIKAYTLGYENMTVDFDEINQAKATAKLHSIDHIIRRVKPNIYSDKILDWIDCYEEPYYSITPEYIVSEIAKSNNSKVVLNGIGGDELFAGYKYYRYNQYALFPRLGFLDQIFTSLPNTKLSKLARIIISTQPHNVHTLSFMNSNENDLKRLFSFDKPIPTSIPKFLGDLYAPGIEFLDKMEAISYMDIKNYIGNQHVHHIDQFTMFHSLEGRFPFLDHNFIEASFKVPFSYKLYKGQSKFLLREVSKKYLSPETLSMKKRGFTLPLLDLMKNDLRPLIIDSLISLSSREFVRRDTIMHYLHSFINDRFQINKLWHLVSLELWYQRFIDQ